MGDPIVDPNDRDFFSDENMLALAVDADYADYAPANGETNVRADGSIIPGRPAGDNSALPFGDGVEIVNTGSK